MRSFSSDSLSSSTGNSSSSSSCDSAENSENVQNDNDDNYANIPIQNRKGINVEKICLKYEADNEGEDLEVDVVGMQYTSPVIFYSIIITIIRR